MSYRHARVFTVEPNDGGLVSFSYSFQTMNGWVCSQSDIWMWCNTFKASLRTLWYQRHFYEIWTRYEALRKDTNAACADIKTKVTAEKQKHLIVRKPRPARARRPHAT